MPSRLYAQIKARLILRLVRAAAQADIAEEFGMTWNDVVVAINIDQRFRQKLIAHDRLCMELEALPEDDRADHYR